MKNNVYYAFAPQAQRVPTGDGSFCVTNGTLAAWTVMTGGTNTLPIYPQFAGPMPTRTLTWNPATRKDWWLPGPTGYQLVAGSPVWGVGVNPKLFGATGSDSNFAGRTLNSATGYNVGAH